MTDHNWLLGFAFGFAFGALLSYGALLASLACEAIKSTIEFKRERNADADQH